MEELRGISLSMWRKRRCASGGSRSERRCARAMRRKGIARECPSSRRCHDSVGMTQGQALALSEHERLRHGGPCHEVAWLGNGGRRCSRPWRMRPLPCWRYGASPSGGLPARRGCTAAQTGQPDDDVPPRTARPRKIASPTDAARLARGFYCHIGSCSFRGLDQARCKFSAKLNEASRSISVTWESMMLRSRKIS